MSITLLQLETHFFKNSKLETSLRSVAGITVAGTSCSASDPQKMVFRSAAPVRPVDVLAMQIPDPHLDLLN